MSSNYCLMLLKQLKHSISSSLFSKYEEKAKQQAKHIWSSKDIVHRTLFSDKNVHYRLISSVTEKSTLKESLADQVVLANYFQLQRKLKKLRAHSYSVNLSVAILNSVLSTTSLSPFSLESLSIATSF